LPTALGYTPRPVRSASFIITITLVNVDQFKNSFTLSFENELTDRLRYIAAAVHC